MMRFVSFIVFIVSVIFNSSYAFVPDTDDLHIINLLYDDFPRVFSLGEVCPYKEFYLDCNKCYCKTDTDKPICTLMSCPEIPQIDNWSNGKPCPAQKPFHWKCNDCFCGESGTEAICTKKEQIMSEATINSKELFGSNKSHKSNK